MTHSTIPERLAALRRVMQQRSITACIVPTADPHLSEYLPAHWQVRAWMSGFEGSSGTLVVTSDFAGLWTDSRYFAQAERQLVGSGIDLMKMHDASTPDHVNWLGQRVQPGHRVACAADMLSLTTERRMRAILSAAGAHLVEDDLPARVWANRPALPRARIFEHPLEYAIQSRTAKLARIRTAMADAGASHHLVSALDEIAWLLNLRGSDIEYNPVFLAHALIDASSATLFVDASKLDDLPLPRAAGEDRDARAPASGGRSLLAGLQADGIAIAPYEAIGEALARLAPDAKLLLAPGQVCAALARAVPEPVARIEAPGPIGAAKARKGADELQHVRTAMGHDGVALVRAARWLERSLNADAILTELDVDAKLRELRSRQPGFLSESFATIAGYQENAALPHYQATPEAHARLAPRGMLLIDSGAQYLGGTTDVTRMWSLGETTAAQRRDVTLVLKGVIALSRARFPRGASGEQLDALARAPIWAAATDYGHGTGHGVGYCLNVHEGPQAIRPPRTGAHLEPLDVGMITSIEPGIYKPGRYGVRIENLVATVAAGAGEFGEFLAFETLTLCPVDTRLLDPSLLDADEITWLDGYHATVRERLAPLLEDAEDRAWLAERCVPLGANGTA